MIFKKLKSPEYVCNVQFYSFLRNQTIENYRNPNQLLSEPDKPKLLTTKASQRKLSKSNYAKEKNEFRGYLKNNEFMRVGQEEEEDPKKIADTGPGLEKLL